MKALRSKLSPKDAISEKRRYSLGVSHCTAQGRNLPVRNFGTLGPFFNLPGLRFSVIGGEFRV